MVDEIEAGALRGKFSESDRKVTWGEHRAEPTRRTETVSYYYHRDTFDSHEAVERLANAVLERHHITRPPIDIDWVAEQEGLRYELEDYANASGAYYRLGPTQARALISKREHPLRRVFTKAHELAHHLMDEPSQTWIAGTNLPLPTAYRGRTSHENHEWFAACLLMPRDWLGSFMRERGWQLERADLIETVARMFGVSIGAAAVRLERLGHLERRPTE